MDRFMTDTGFRIKTALWFFGISMLCITFFYIVTYRQVTTAKVMFIGWDTKIDVERYQTNRYEGWNIPAGGIEVDHYLKKSGTKRVYDHKECKTEKDKQVCTDIYRTEPVYDWWYVYDIDEWTWLKALKSAGQGYDWYWPDTTDETYIDQPVIGNKRLGLHSTHFYVILVSKTLNEEKQYSVDMVENLWKTFTMHDDYDLTLNFFGSIVKINKRGYF